MPNIGGPGTRKRLLLNVVMQSTVLNAASAWNSITKVKKYNGKRC